MFLRRCVLALCVVALSALAASPDNARIAGRYKEMLEKNPVEGIALDRLWKLAQDNGTTAQLLEEYKAEAANEHFTGALIYGHLLRKAGRVDEARAAYERAASLDAKSPLPHLALAQMASERNQPDKAALAFEKAAALLPPADPRLSEALLKSGNAWLAANDSDKAAEAFERTCALSPDDLSLRQRLANVYEQHGLGERAIPHFQFIESRGDAAQRAQAAQHLARIHQSRGDPDAAIAALDRALSLTSPGNWLRSELQAQLIRLYQRHHRTAELEERWKKYVEQNPRDLGGYLQLVDFYERTADLDSERLWLEKLCALAPKNADFKIKLARLCVQLGQTERAAALFDELLATQPTNADLVFERAQIDLQRNATSAARARIESLLQRLPNDETLPARAIAWFDKNRLPDAVEQHLKQNAARGDDDSASLALANWYFSQRRPEDAQRALRRLVKDNQQPEAKAAAHAKIADALKEQSETEGAIAALQRATDLQPRSTDYRLALADLLLSSQRFDEAQREAEEAFALAASDATRVVADQKIFQIFQARIAQSDEHTSTPSLLDLRSPITLLPHPSQRANSASAHQLQGFISRLAQQAFREPSPEKFLRLARWQIWTRRNKEALITARRVIALDANSVAARELAVKAAEADDLKPIAISYLQELRKLDLSNSATYAKRIGRLLLESGRVDEALDVFNQLERAHPGDPETLTDLALAQQQAERWFDALDTWQRAFDASPPTRKKELTQPLLRVLDRLNLSQKGAELLLHAVDAQADESARSATLQDLLGFCKRHELVAWLESEFAKRHKARPDDNFTAIAYAKILKAAGRTRESFDVLADAAFTSHNEPAALEELVREAEELGNIRAAIEFQRQLLRLRQQSDPAPLEKLAALQAADLDIEGAHATWNKVRQLFPRDPDTLKLAAEFFLRWGVDEQAREILRAIRVLDPANTQALLALAKLALDAGASAEALSCFEQILQNTPPGKRDEPLKIPVTKAAVDTGGLRQAYSSALRLRYTRPNGEIMKMLRNLWSEETGSASEAAEPDVRLTAIRDYSQTLVATGNKAALRSWIARWENAESRNEALWACFYSGANDCALTELRALLARAPLDDRARNGFIWLTLEMGTYDALRDWLLNPARTPNEKQILPVVLEQFLKNNHGVLDPQLVPTLFSERFDLWNVMWECAVKLAAQSHLAEAAQLGERVFAHHNHAANYAVEIARWHLCLGEKNKAQKVLRAALGQTGDSFDQPIYEAWREYYLLLPEPERAAFVETAARNLDATRAPLHAAITMTLLRGLQGDENGAKASLVRLLNSRPLAMLSWENTGQSGNRFWTFVLTAGVQLQSWKLHALADFFWERTLADPAAIRLQGDQAVAISREVRMRRFASKLLRADVTEAEALLAGYVQASRSDDAQMFASVLENNGWPLQSAHLYRELWHRDRDNATLLRNLLNACRAANDIETAKSVLREFLSEDAGAKAALHREATLQLADILEKENDLSGARKLIERSLAFTPGDDAQLLERAARLHERTGNLTAAESAYRRLLSRDASNTSARLALATVLKRAQKPSEAITVLSAAKVPNPEIEQKLAEVYLAAGKLEEALLQAEKLVRAPNAAGIAELATRFAEAGQRKHGLRLLQTAVAKTKHPRAAFELESKFVEMLAEEHPKLARQALRRLDTLAADAPGLEPALFELEERLAPALGLDLEKRLATEWQDGSLTAGVKLVERFAKADDRAKLDTMLATLLARDDLSESALQMLDAQLKQAQRLDAAVQVEAALCRKNRLDPRLACDYARTLAALGRNDEAIRELERLALRVIFDDSIAVEIAPLFAQVGERAWAREMFATAVAADPGVRDFGAYLGYARLLREDGRLGPAMRLLQLAFRNPLNREVDEIVAFYAAAGRLERLENETAKFRLAPENLRALHAALFAHCVVAGGDARPQHLYREPLRVLQRHPEIVHLEKARVQLRPLLARNADAFAPVTALLETAVAQSASGKSEADAIARELALIYGEWAERELAAFTAHAALKHLERANHLAPDHFQIAQRLCALLLERNNREHAVQVLDRLLRVTRDESDKLKAQQLLATIKAK